jgi:hypothetical protein
MISVICCGQMGSISRVGQRIEAEVSPVLEKGSFSVQIPD